MSRQIEEKLDQFKKHIQKSREGSMTPKTKLNRNQSVDPKELTFRSNHFKGEGLDINDQNAKDLSRFKRLQGQNAGGGSVDDTQVKLKIKKNPNFGGGQLPLPTYQSSDDDIPLGFSRRKRLSSASSFQKNFQPQAATNIVNLTRDEDNIVKPSRQRESRRQEEQYSQDMTRSRRQEEQYSQDMIRARKEEEEDRIHMETEQMLEMKREEIQQRLKEHDIAIKMEKEKLYQSQIQEQYEESYRVKESRHKDHHQHQHHNHHHHQKQQSQPQIAFPSYQQNPPQQMFYAGQFNQQPMSTYPLQMQYPMQQYPQQNYFPPQMMPNIPQYTNLDIPGHLDQNLKQMQETLQKLKQENSVLKGELNKKQVLNADLENSFNQFDNEKYQQNAQTNLKLKQQVEDMKRKEIELKSKLSSLQANKQYLHGRTTTLSMDIDTQDRQEEALNRQITDFNGLIREKESYIKQLMNELNSLKESKEQFQSELQVLSHKEEFMVNELIFKEDQLNEILINNDDMKRKIQAGQSQSKYLLAENERLKKELNQLREESAVLKASTDFVQNELMGLNEHLNEYEHKLVMSQTTIDQLQRQNQQEKNELSHYNATIANQLKAYEELKNQLSIIVERNQRISMQNEMMMIRQKQQQESLLMQMSTAQKQMQKDEFRDQPYMNENMDIKVPREREMINEEQQSTMVNVQQRQQPKRKEQKQEMKEEGSPFQENQRKNKQGESMMNTLKWEEDDPYQIPSNEKNQKTQNQNQLKNTNRGQMYKHEGQAMAGLLNWEEERQNDNTNIRHSQPANLDRKQRNDNIIENQHERQRSKSAKRQDQMNQLMQWEDEEVIKEQRIKQSEDVKIQQPVQERSISAERKRKEGQAMQNVLSWDKQSPFRDRQIMKDAEESMKWKTKVPEQPVVTYENESPPKQRGIEIRSKHYGQQMAGLLSFQEPNQSFSTPNTKQSQQQQKSNSAQNPKYGTIQVSLGGTQNSQQMSMQNIRNDETQFYTPNRNQKGNSKAQNSQLSSSKIQTQGSMKKMSNELEKDLSSGNSTPKPKNYGQINEQLHQKQQNRKENLDKFLLQMQIEKEKLVGEFEKIGEHPKTTQQYRRKEAIQGEMQVLNSNIANIKNKLKQLKPT